MKKKDYIHVGTFGQPQGLKGEIKINIFTVSLESFKILKSYFIDENKSILINKKIKQVGKKIIASIENSKDRDEALSFKGKQIFTLRENFPKTKNNEFYVIDLIGSKVVDLKENYLGKVEDIKNFGAGDLLEINNLNKNNFYIPMNKENLINVDIDNKIITVDPIEGLLKLT